jgi:hypothetical protein
MSNVINSKTLIEDELWSNIDQNDYIIFPLHGLFYTKSLKIINQANGVTLKEGEDYVTFNLNVDATLKTGEKIERNIKIINKQFQHVLIEYYALGLTNKTSNVEIVNNFNTIRNREKQVKWSQLKGKPSAFPPDINHLHDARAVYGMEYIIRALESVKKAVIQGSSSYKGSLDQPMQYFRDLFDEHIDDVNNPHQTNKNNIGLDNIENYPLSSQTEAEEGLSSSSYMTPLRVKNFIDLNVVTLLDAHIQDFSNPHQVTKAHVGLGNIENYGVASLSEVMSNVSIDKYSSPLTNKFLIEQGLLVIDNHLNDFSNPHQVTKVQVGLSSVKNYPIATRQEASQAISNERYITPLRVNDVMLSTIENDWNYIFLTKNKEINGSIRVLTSPVRIEIFANGLWRQVFNAQWK